MIYFYDMAHYALRFDAFALQIINLAEALYYAVRPLCLIWLVFHSIIFELATPKKIVSDIYANKIIQFFTKKI